ncbi:MAG: aldehyde dehydrogenase family protein [Pseudomonadota bacterium]
MAKENSQRLAVAKTVKMFIGGAFPRTESGRVYKVNNRKGQLIANACRASRKDLREAVVAARGRAGAWQGISAYLRSQILYRMAEILEERRDTFIDARRALGDTPRSATRSVDRAIDDIVYYAGWCDKLTQVFGSVNPVASPHYNFSSLEPMGVVAALVGHGQGLKGLIDVVVPALAGGNTVVVLADEADPLTAILFAEVAHASDVPPGALNVLTGQVADVAPSMASHKDINALVHTLTDAAQAAECARLSAINIKRVIARDPARKGQMPSAYRVLDTVETKTTWHPIGV